MQTGILSLSFTGIEKSTAFFVFLPEIRKIFANIEVQRAIYRGFPKGFNRCWVLGAFGRVPHVHLRSLQTRSAACPVPSVPHQAAALPLDGTRTSPKTHSRLRHGIWQLFQLLLRILKEIKNSNKKGRSAAPAGREAADSAGRGRA